MKLITGILFILVLILAAGFIWQATRMDLTASEVAKVLGMKHWRYRVPETTGGIAGFKPGEVIMVAIFPSIDGEQLAFSISGKDSSMNGRFQGNPLKGASIMWKNVDEVGTDGNLAKAFKSGNASWTTTNPTEVVLRVCVSDTP